MRFKAWLDLSPEYRQAVEGHTPWTPETKEPQPVLVSDVREEPSLEHLCPAIEAEGIRALAFFPLTADDRLLGKFMLYYPEPHELTRQEILIAQTIAAHVAFALDRHEVRQERREWREHLEGVFRSPIVGIAEIDTEARLRVVNDRFCDIVGRSRDELLSRLTCFDITHEDDREQMAKGIEGLATGAEHFILDERYVKPNGDIVWVSNSVSAIHDENGNLKGAIAVVSDMTRRRVGEQRVRDSEAQLMTELIAAQRLQVASSQLIREDDVNAVYETILDTAMTIMSSDFASIQMLYPERGPGGELRLLGFRGFTPEAASFWEWVRPASESTCGVALRAEQRVVVSDVTICDFLAGSEDLIYYLQTGIAAVQSTPLVSRGGKLIGMILDPLATDARAHGARPAPVRCTGTAGSRPYRAVAGPDAARRTQRGHPVDHRQHVGRVVPAGPGRSHRNDEPGRRANHRPTASPTCKAGCCTRPCIACTRTARPSTAPTVPSTRRRASCECSAHTKTSLRGRTARSTTSSATWRPCIKTATPGLCAGCARRHGREAG